MQGRSSCVTVYERVHNYLTFQDQTALLGMWGNNIIIKRVFHNSGERSFEINSQTNDTPPLCAPDAMR